MVIGAQFNQGGLATATSLTRVLTVAHTVTTNASLAGKLFPVDNHVGWLKNPKMSCRMCVWESCEE